MLFSSAYFNLGLSTLIAAVGAGPLPIYENALYVRHGGGHGGGGNSLTPHEIAVQNSGPATTVKIVYKDNPDAEALKLARGKPKGHNNKMAEDVVKGFLDYSEVKASMGANTLKDLEWDIPEYIYEEFPKSEEPNVYLTVTGPKQCPCEVHAYYYIKKDGKKPEGLVKSATHTLYEWTDPEKGK